MPGPIGFILALAKAAAAKLKRKPGTPTPVALLERAQRAQAALVGPKAYYCLGAGGREAILGDYVIQDPHEPKELTKTRRARGSVYADCSGAIAGVLGIHRRIPDYAAGWGYFSTDGVLADAQDAAVELVAPATIGEGARPWEFLVVYGAIDRDGDGKRDAIGHIGIVAEVPEGWVYTGAASLLALKIWHCAASSSATGAIRISDGRPWSTRGQLLRIL